ncbi:TPA: AAA family ATPase [Staphylococcus aureus]
MKPLHLKLNNFGPFLKEEIDFSKIDNNELFLISGKTGSGKTMIFDAMTYALFGKASTEQREENDLRSHFADGKQPMSVTFEFQLNHRIYKVHRQGPYIKEGNTTKTNAKFDVFEMVDGKYEIRESKVISGTQFIIELLGVNADQFRQLFILPQGEFKRFLISNSREKQGILRTLFDSEKFEAIREILKEEVKKEKAQIENRYQQIDLLWQEIESFDDDKIKGLLEVATQQIDKVIENIPLLQVRSKEILAFVNESKETAIKEYEIIEKKTLENNILKDNINQLNKNKIDFVQLKEQQPEIEEIEAKLKLLQDITNLLNYIENREKIETKIANCKKDISKTNNKILNLECDKRTIDKEKKMLEENGDLIESKISFIDKTRVLFNDINKYQQSYLNIERLRTEGEQLGDELNNLIKGLEKVEDSIGNNESDYEKIIELNNAITNINNEINVIKENENALNNQRDLNKFIEQMKEEKDNLTLQIHNKQLRLNKNESELKICRDLITEFETLSKYNNITNFEVDYKKYVQDVNQHQEHSKEIEDKLIQLSQRKLIEQNNLNHYENQLETYNNDLELNEQSIEMEMSRLNLTDDNDINEIIAWRGEQEELEQKRDTYKKRYHEFEMEIARLESLTKDKELLDSDKLIDEYELKKGKMNTLIDEYSAVHYQCQNNIKKTQSIVSHINYLNQELKDQQEIFQLAEIVSGKNNKNLTLENFVLIYYLDQIIAQANLRLATMSDNRYQLIRREAVSHGLSGLEIDVFDLHSNKSRHISSLSGGETFQSSLALALGLSEIVQQQSGGISLESIFIDEGFGTLDQETLETALDTLLNLKSTGRMVGIISHVSELKNRIPLVLEVKSDQYQSSTRFKRN